MRVRITGILASAVLIWAAVVGAQGAAPVLEIWEVQGDGMSSPYEGRRVTTRDNVVTAVGDDLFFIQTPDARTDGDPWTSDGIVVVLGLRPAVSVGDVVDVTGTVRESFGQTELVDGPLISITSTGQPRPSAVILDRDTPTSLQPWPETELERFEGMWVELPSGVVSAPSDRFGEACVAAGGTRLFREPGILYPGLAGLAVWDGNPEGFELDPYGLGGAGSDLSVGTIVRAAGVLAYDFGAYQLWPVSLDIVAEPDLPRPVAAAHPGEATLATQNLLRLGDDGGDVPGDVKLEKLSRQVREVLGSPDVLAVQEVMALEDLDDLARRIIGDDPGVGYAAYLLEGNDVSGIDVGFLVRDSVEVEGVEQVGSDVRFTWDDTLLFDRPPLVLEAVLPVAGEDLAMTLVAIHLRSLGGIDDPGDGERVRRKRYEQSLWLSEWIQERQGADASRPLIVLGDLNAYEFSDGFVDVLGQLTGDPDPDGALQPVTEVVDPELVDWVRRLPSSERYSFIFGCSAQVLDHILSNRAATGWVRGVAFGRGNADAPHTAALDAETARGSSDHDGLVLYLGPRHRRGAGRRIEAGRAR